MITLNRVFFGRNRHREKEYDDVFSITYKSLAVLSNIVFLVIFPPVIAISNIFSHSFFLSIMNICLSVGYVAKVIHKIKEGEVSPLDLSISAIFLALSLAITFYLAPIISLVHLFDVIGIINLVATGVNSFFLVRNLLVPPCQAFVRYVMTFFGNEINTSVFNKAPLSLEQDRPVIDRLLRKFYNHDSFSDSFNEHQLVPLNNMLSTLSRYINKYNEPFLGNLINHDRINVLENAVSQYIVNGNTDNSTVFIKRKIDFKTTKLKLLTQAQRELIAGQETKQPLNYSFFEPNSQRAEGQEEDDYALGLSLLNDEITKQNNKLALLQSCLVTPHNCSM